MNIPEIVARAQAMYAQGSDDNIEIEDHAQVSRGGEDACGSWVQAWVWVPDDPTPEGDPDEWGDE